MGKETASEKAARRRRITFKGDSDEVDTYLKDIQAEFDKKYCAELVKAQISISDGHEHVAISGAILQKFAEQSMHVVGDDYDTHAIKHVFVYFKQTI